MTQINCVSAVPTQPESLLPLDSGDGALVLSMGARREARESHIAQQNLSLLTLLFTDIVGSTELVQKLGNEGWRTLLARHHHIVREQVGDFRGREIDHAGDGFFLSFDKPGQAIACARSVRDSLSAIGLTVRAGAHAGECEQSVEGVVGVAVHVAARIAAIARPGEILLSATLKDILAGSRFAFEDRHWHTLRGLHEKRRLYALCG